ncbi:hypothetical protein D5047_10180 [Verminephrobacter eiseniae]|nr:hypothetical protein [Verminephrobacter eiseniae]
MPARAGALALLPGCLSVCGVAAWSVFRLIEPRNLQTGHDMRVAARPMREKMLPRIRIFQRHAAP